MNIDREVLEWVLSMAQMQEYECPREEDLRNKFIAQATEVLNAPLFQVGNIVRHKYDEPDDEGWLSASSKEGWDPYGCLVVYSVGTCTNGETYLTFTPGPDPVTALAKHFRKVG